jgi:tetratricopeptide (TPR) repeat protein
LPQPYRHLAQAGEELGDRAAAIRACRTLLRLDPPDPAGTHFQLARLLHQAGDAGARRHLLQALEEAPRFREGHRLLLEMAGSSASRTNARPEAGPEAAPEPKAK